MIKIKKIKISVGGQVAEATLFDKENPKTCDVIWNSLPIEADLHTAKIAGEEVFFIVPFLIHQEKGVEFIEAGSISYWPPRQMICMYYFPGKVKIKEATVWAKITKNLEGIIEEFNTVRHKQGKKILIQKGS